MPAPVTNTRHLIVLLDNGKIHRGDPVQELLARTSRLHLEPFLPYAPELNPDEGVWNHLEQNLANGRPDTQAELMNVLADEICRLAASQPLLRGCIQQSELPFFFTLNIVLFMRRSILSN
jgi:putative transposase